MKKTARITLFYALIGVVSLLLSCENKKKDEDETVLSKPTPEELEPPVTEGAWITTSFVDPLGSKTDIVDKDLADGGPRLPISMTYSKANAPIALFRASAKGETGVLNEVPFLAFFTEQKAAVTIRHVKSLNGQNIGSQLVLPQDCPDLFKEGHVAPEGQVLYCLPLINAAVPNFLIPTDNSGSYVHEFIIGLKAGGKGAGVLATKIGCQIIIPGSNLSVGASADIMALHLSDRLTIATNDLVGSPRRDFPAFEVKGAIAPGVQTAWILTFSGVSMTFDEEVFFEQPVVAGDIPAKPLISRGSAFYKRKTSISSLEHFKIRLLNGAPGATASAFNIASNAASLVEIPIEDGSQPLRIFISPDFGSENAVKSMSEYVKPLGPTFCPKEIAAFKPEEWRQSRNNNGYVACDAFTRSRLVDTAEALKKGVTSPIETYFGAFSYLPRLGGNVLGGMNGVLSLRVHLTGKLKVAVRNPHAPETVTVVGEIPLDTSYFFPTALSEMNDVIIAAKGTPGLDTVLSSMQRKGILELPRRDEGRLVAFPFQGEERDDLLH